MRNDEAAHRERREAAKFAQLARVAAGEFMAQAAAAGDTPEGRRAQQRYEGQMSRAAELDKIAAGEGE